MRIVCFPRNSQPTQLCNHYTLFMKQIYYGNILLLYPVGKCIHPEGIGYESEFFCTLKLKLRFTYASEKTYTVLYIFIESHRPTANCLLCHLNTA